MFIKPDDYIILMEDTIYNPFSSDDLKRIVDSGVGLIYLSDAICWKEIARWDGIPDWDRLDRYIEKYFDTGLRLLLPFSFNMPEWFPEEFYLEDNRGIPNYANKDLIAVVDNAIQAVMQHVLFMKDRIQVTYAIPAGGEFLWDGVRTEPFPVSNKVIHSFVIGRQKLLVQQHGEVWLNYHNFMGGSGNWNNLYLSDLYFAMREEFTDNHFYSLQFAHFSINGIHQTTWEQQSLITKYAEKYGVQSFVGSDYCEGMLKNFDATIKQKAWGYFTCPRHFENPVKHDVIEPWMVETIKETNKKFKEHYGN